MTDLRYGLISMYQDVAYLAYDKREMPVFGIVDDMVISGSVVRMM